MSINTHSLSCREIEIAAKKIFETALDQFICKTCQNTTLFTMGPQSAQCSLWQLQFQWFFIVTRTWVQWNYLYFTCKSKYAKSRHVSSVTKLQKYSSESCWSLFVHGDLSASPWPVIVQQVCSALIKCFFFYLPRTPTMAKTAPSAL